MMKIQIKHRDTGNVIFESDAASFKLAVLDAVTKKIPLTGADLSGQDLSNMELQGGVFVDSRFDGSSFVGSRFDGSRFDGSRFDGSRFDGSTAELLACSWPEAKTDLFKVLDVASDEVPGLLQALRDGKVDGNLYEGECACLIGTIANLRHCNYRELQNLNPDVSRPAELWFFGISEGDTPENNPIVEITCKWIEEWQKAHATAEGGAK